LVKKISAKSFVFLLLFMTGFNGELQAHGDRQGGVSPTSLQKQVGEIKILDIRSEKDYAKDHIDTAVVLPLKEISESRLTQLGFQKGDEIVVYGNSEIDSKKVMRLLCTGTLRSPPRRRNSF
jgi:hypothetical protein